MANGLVYLMPSTCISCLIDSFQRALLVLEAVVGKHWRLPHAKLLHGILLKFFFHFWSPCLIILSRVFIKSWIKNLTVQQQSCNNKKIHRWRQSLLDNPFLNRFCYICSDHVNSDFSLVQGYSFLVMKIFNYKLSIDQHKVSLAPDILHSNLPNRFINKNIIVWFHKTR